MRNRWILIIVIVCLLLLLFGLPLLGVSIPWLVAVSALAGFVSAGIVLRLDQLVRRKNLIQNSDPLYYFTIFLYLSVNFALLIFALVAHFKISSTLASMAQCLCAMSGALLITREWLLHRITAASAKENPAG